VRIEAYRVLERLATEDTCLGALFTSYSFDPAFFEDHVLRAVLRLTSDPVEQAERYHQEARRALQETPVVAIVDAAERQPGRRLPFDLLEVTNVVFHPKSALLLYEKNARLLIGSGNLTFAGHGGNTELFLCTDLAYNAPTDVALLAAFAAHLDRLRTLVRRPGTQLDLFREELQRRLPATPPAAGAARLALLDSTTAPIVDQLLDLLPADAVIESVGMLAPFYERDDASEPDASSVFGVLAPRTTKNATLDVGVAWDNAQIHASGVALQSSETQLEEGLGGLWTWSRDTDAGRVLEHVVPMALGPKTLSYLDESGQQRRWPLDEALEAIEQRTLWMQPPPSAFGPQQAVAAAASHFAEVRLWLHPTTRLVDGRPLHRPLHAKLLVLGYRAGRSRSTLVVVGSPNMSRRALLMQAGAGQGNVEVALAFRLDGSSALRDFVPELVHAPASAIALSERDFPELGRNYALAIEEASHDPRNGTLVITWSPEAADLPAWQLTYDGAQLAASPSPPTAPVTVSEFVLRPATAEVVLHVDGGEYPAPILVTDLIALPATSAGAALGLDELLYHLGRRIGAERVLQIVERKAAGDDEAGLATIFGEGFGPTDVFRAWWSVAADLADPSLSVQAFRLRVEGALGVGAAWARMVEEAGRQTLPVEEVWFYGAELLRELSGVVLPPTADRDAKQALLTAFCDRVRNDLAGLNLAAEAHPWAQRILTFYAETRA
jgi:hypothetical protein